MTETNTFGGTAVAEPPAADVSNPEFTDGDGNRRKLLIVGAIVGLLILAAAAYFLLFHKGSSSSATPTGTVPHGTPVHSSGTTTKSGGSKAKTKVVTLPRVGKHAVGHDPFAALVQQPVVSDSGSGTGNGSSSGSNSSSSTGNGTSSSTSGNTSGSTGTQNGNTGTQSNQSGSSKTTTKTPPVAPQYLKFDKDTKNTATFTLFLSNGEGRSRAETVTVRAPKAGAMQGCNPAQKFCGTRFLQHYGLLSINGNTVSIQIGDAGYQLRKGQKISATG